MRLIIFEDIISRRFISRLDPRVRVACLLAFAVIICLSMRPVVLISGFIAAMFLVVISGISPARALKRMAALNLFMLFLAATLPLMMPGKAFLQLGHLTWSVEGCGRALLIAARANAVMLMLTALVGTMETAHLGFAMHGLSVPAKFVHLFLFMIRYIEVIHQEYHRLRDAMLLRAFRPRFDRHTFRTIGFMVGQLLVRGVNRSERIMQAMKCRGFRGKFYILTPTHIEGGDIAFSLVAVTGIVMLAMLEWL